MDDSSSSLETGFSNFKLDWLDPVLFQALHLLYNEVPLYQIANPKWS